MRAGVEPRHPPPEGFDLKPPPLQVVPVHVRDLQLAAVGRLQSAGHVHHVGVVEVEARDGVVGGGRVGFFLNGERLARLVEVHDPVALGVVHVVGEHGASLVLPGGPAQLCPQPLAVEDVVAEDEAHVVAVDEVGPNRERLRDALRLGLLGVPQVESPLVPVPQQILKAGQVLRRRDEQDVPDACPHQRGERVIHHRFVVDGQQLLADRPGGRAQAGARTAGEENALSGARRFIHGQC